MRSEGVVAFVVNPVAGKGRTIKVWESLQNELRLQRIPHRVYMTENAGNGEYQAHKAVSDGVRRVVSVGGDGTLQEVINGVFGCNIEVGVLPFGTGNDFARSTRIPQNPKDALMFAINADAVPTDLGRVCRRVFVNSAGVGFDAEVVNDTNHRRMFLNGTLTYMISVFAMLRKYRCVAAELRLDDQKIAQPMLLAALANGRYFGGGMQIAPSADLADGMLDVVVASNLSRLETVALLAHVYKGTHIHHPKAGVYRAKRIQVVTTPEVFIQADGEIVGKTPACFEILPSAVLMAR